MKKLVLSLVCVLLSFTALSAHDLSDSVRVSLLTCDPAEAVYARFGHTGIRVFDPADGYDVVYHYGVFDFDSDSFIARFIQGATDYQIGRAPTELFLREYVQRKSTVVEQVLNLTPGEIAKINAALEKNYLPENRIYRYNFIYDNCATRPFFMITGALSAAPMFTYSHPTTTFRRIVGDYVGMNTWLRFGIDILIGRESDLPVTTESLIGFPEYTMRLIGSAVLERPEGEQNLVSQTEPLCLYPRIGTDEEPLFNPIYVCCFLLLLLTLLSYWSWKRGKYMAWLDVVLFAVFGLLGSVVFFLTFFSYHPLVGTNLNLLWMNPLQLLFAIALIVPKWRKNLSWYALFNALTTIVAIIVCMTQIQGMHPAFLPLMGILLVRSVLFFQMNRLKVNR